MPKPILIADPYLCLVPLPPLVIPNITPRTQSPVRPPTPYYATHHNPNGLHPSLKDDKAPLIKERESLEKDQEQVNGKKQNSEEKKSIKITEKEWKFSLDDLIRVRHPDQGGDLKKGVMVGRMRKESENISQAMCLRWKSIRSGLVNSTSQSFVLKKLELSGYLISTPARTPLLAQELHLDNNLISRTHAEIFIDHHGQPFLLDTKSLHGTYILRSSDLSVLKELKKGVPYPLHHSDLVRFGKKFKDELAPPVFRVEIPRQWSHLHESDRSRAPKPVFHPYLDRPMTVRIHVLERAVSPRHDGASLGDSEEDAWLSGNSLKYRTTESGVGKSDKSVSHKETARHKHHGHHEHHKTSTVVSKMPIAKVTSPRSTHQDRNIQLPVVKSEHRRRDKDDIAKLNASQLTGSKLSEEQVRKTESPPIGLETKGKPSSPPVSTKGAYGVPPSVLYDTDEDRAFDRSRSGSGQPVSRMSQLDQVEEEEIIVTSTSKKMKIEAIMVDSDVEIITPISKLIKKNGSSTSPFVVDDDDGLPEVRDIHDKALFSALDNPTQDAKQGTQGTATVELGVKPVHPIAEEIRLEHRQINQLNIRLDIAEFPPKHGHGVMAVVGEASIDLNSTGELKEHIKKEGVPVTSAELPQSADERYASATSCDHAENGSTDDSSQVQTTLLSPPYKPSFSTPTRRPSSPVNRPRTPSIKDDKKPDSQGVDHDDEDRYSEDSMTFSEACARGAYVRLWPKDEYPQSEQHSEAGDSNSSYSSEVDDEGDGSEDSHMSYGSDKYDDKEKSCSESMSESEESDLSYGSQRDDGKPEESHSPYASERYDGNPEESHLPYASERYDDDSEGLYDEEEEELVYDDEDSHMSDHSEQDGRSYVSEADDASRRSDDGELYVSQHQNSDRHEISDFSDAPDVDKPYHDDRDVSSDYGHNDERHISEDRLNHSAQDEVSNVPVDESNHLPGFNKISDSHKELLHTALKVEQGVSGKREAVELQNASERELEWRDGGIDYEDEGRGGGVDYVDEQRGDVMEYDEDGDLEDQEEYDEEDEQEEEDYEDEEEEEDDNYAEDEDEYGEEDDYLEDEEDNHVDEEEQEVMDQAEDREYGRDDEHQQEAVKKYEEDNVDPASMVDNPNIFQTGDETPLTHVIEAVQVGNSVHTEVVDVQVSSTDHSNTIQTNGEIPPVQVMGVVAVGDSVNSESVDHQAEEMIVKDEHGVTQETESPIWRMASPLESLSTGMMEFSEAVWSSSRLGTYDTTRPLMYNVNDNLHFRTPSLTSSNRASSQEVILTPPTKRKLSEVEEQVTIDTAVQTEQHFLSSINIHVPSPRTPSASLTSGHTSSSHTSAPNETSPVQDKQPGVVTHARGEKERQDEQRHKKEIERERRTGEPPRKKRDLGMVVLGMALGTAATIAGLLQFAD
ncbi:hypothetical protein TREMEDRAFT_60770 [Tremella mesenterica DSM 1558]|uniref:uncharacterized protein n=1 Tax=Tremella mesenterica (strain ATCC 24925 / CBS 8224 / DSM 1558 / NBRC 9311 / NRRL Y-6157 / RJB 2259-6 / UBC 559-6) TaxID=578456 RepID=UPI0003F4A0D7|nr:uncharacterized protein TREMEDRAFT_60770 [Tremella mesenterica DSM 1558]EIW71850.1 hypothetical protein TREMEDRAFT_60770 [Tremella mesenterica DSM 1558]